MTSSSVNHDIASQYFKGILKGGGLEINFADIQSADPMIVQLIVIVSIFIFYTTHNNKIIRNSSI